jgi:hypothetical protein
MEWAGDVVQCWALVLEMLKLSVPLPLKKLRGFYSASELYRPSDRRLSAKLVPTFADRGVAWSAQRIPRPLILFSSPEPLLFHSSSPSIILTRLSGPRSRPTTSQKI